LKIIKQVEDKHLIEKYINDRSITIEKILEDCQQAIEVKHKIEQQNKVMSAF